MAEPSFSVPADRRQKTSGSGQVTLEKVLGITTVSSSGITSDPNTGLIAYPAGSVVVLLQPIKNQQNHILNESRKPFTAVAFSHDGKHLATGESGHMPCVRVWEVGGSQVAEVQSHKHGVSCVAFSSNGHFIVSVGYQHDMTVSVWDWRKGSIVASNKVSSRVLAVSFSQDSSYFVTAGNRHVKFWYLDASREQRVYSTVPLIGRSGLLNDHKTSVFCGVACGRGLTAPNTYCVTSTGLLCLFNGTRHLEAWVNLKTSSACCLAVSEDFIFCGCADGVIQVFSPNRLQYLTTLQRPHLLRAEQGLQAAGPDAQYPPTLALTLDPCSRMLTCVYGDHSIYVWDVHDMWDMGKIYSAQYHSGCVCSLEVYPEQSDPSRTHLPASSFLSCSSDNTIRFWNGSLSGSHRNVFGDDLLRILYVGGDAHQEEGEAAGGKVGVRVLAISPDGQHLAAGDRSGDLRIIGLQFLDQLVKLEAHESEVVCLEFSPASTGVRLLASAGRDRLIHIFDRDHNYSLLQTLNDHCAPITAIKFTGESPEVHMVTCSVDKSIDFQIAEQTAAGLGFSRRHFVVEKTSLFDMDCSSTQAVVACQDRNVRVYDVDSGKMKRCLKGATSDRGTLLKVQMDPSGSFFATSCSNKNINIFDFKTGECVATMFGHSETVTHLRFSSDCRHLISASGDSCIFVWKLDDHMTSTMRKRLLLRPVHHQTSIRREIFIMAPSAPLPQTHEEEDEADLWTPVRQHTADEVLLLETNGKLPQWFRKLQAQGGVHPLNQSEPEPTQPLCRWSKHSSPLIMCSTKNDPEEEEDFHPQSLEHLLGQEEEPETLVTLSSTFMVSGDSTCSGVDGSLSIDTTTQTPSQLEATGQGAELTWSTQLSLDSACSEGSTGSLDQQHDPDSHSLSQSSSAGSLSPEDDEDRNLLKDHPHNLSSLSEEWFDTDLRTLQAPEEKPFLNPRLSICKRFLARFQDRVRAWPVRAPPSIPNRVAEESHVSAASVKSERSVAGSAAWTQTGSCRADMTSRTHNVSSSLDPAGGAPNVDLDTPLQTENMDNLTFSPTAPPPAGSVLAAGPDLQRSISEAPQDQSSSLQVEATPLQVSIQDRDWSISSFEKTLMNQNQTQSPVPLARPSTCTETRVLPDPGDPVLPGNTDSDVSSESSVPVPPLCASSPFFETLRPHDANTYQSAPPAGVSAQELSTGGPSVLSPLPTNHSQEVCRQQCRHAAVHLQQAAVHLQQAMHLYQQLGSSQPGVLQEALSIFYSHLQGVLHPHTRRNSSTPSLPLEDCGTITPL